MMHELTSHLDRIASSLESKGFLKEAEEIDVISNTMEEYYKQAPEPIEIGRDLKYNKNDPKDLENLYEDWNHPGDMARFRTPEDAIKYNSIHGSAFKKFTESPSYKAMDSGPEESVYRNVNDPSETRPFETGQQAWQTGQQEGKAFKRIETQG